MTDLFARAAESNIAAEAQALAARIAALPIAERVAALNAARAALHAVSPFVGEPVDCVLWVPAATVAANDYNPNSVAPPEMRLLETSILRDGYTQPIVAHQQDDESFVVVDGFHRNRVGRESATVRKRILDHLPVVRIRAGRSDREERMASTIRHNRARGKHAVEPMTGIVSYLAKKGWDDARIGREIGMDPDEVLRFKQITGLADLFGDRAFSQAWEVR